MDYIKAIANIAPFIINNPIECITIILLSLTTGFSSCIFLMKIKQKKIHENENKKIDVTQENIYVNNSNNPFTPFINIKDMVNSPDTIIEINSMYEIKCKRINEQS